MYVGMYVPVHIHMYVCAYTFARVFESQLRAYYSRLFAPMFIRMHTRLFRSVAKLWVYSNPRLGLVGRTTWPRHWRILEAPRESLQMKLKLFEAAKDCP